MEGDGGAVGGELSVDLLKPGDSKKLRKQGFYLLPAIFTLVRFAFNSIFFLWRVSPASCFFPFS